MSLSAYLKSIEQLYASGKATEHSYRSALESLLESYGKNIKATNEPKQIACGAPDLIITRDAVPIGYVEAKDVGKNLDEVEKSEQLVRYLEALPNLILTDYLEFRRYHNGELVQQCRLGSTDKSGKIKKDRAGSEALPGLLQTFYSAHGPVIRSPQDLAQHLAAGARIVRSVTRKSFTGEQDHGPLHDQLEAFRLTLIKNLQPDQFADMYAQTIVYGLFSARVHHRGKSEEFSRRNAAYAIPKTNPFLRDLFDQLAGTRLDERLVWIVDHVANLLARADIAAILENFGKRTRQEDPVVHFYETFLAAYDADMRDSRGVYYTPEPVVNFIVRSVDTILRQDFGVKDGLASSEKIALPRADLLSADRGDCHKVLILDPACGTGTFLFNVIDHIHAHQQQQGQGGMWDLYVREHLLPRLFGFELLMAPYAMAHMKLGWQLRQLGYSFESDERLKIYLTNTLEEAREKAERIAFAQQIEKEASEANEIKTDYPVMAIIGNPPYSGHSANKGRWIQELMHGKGKGAAVSPADYFSVDGHGLNERNPKWLNDDYVKFIRFSQWKIDQTGYGVLAFITNHGYLDNPTFRGMRQSLMQSFDDIYLLDLHGNSKKKEVTPEGDTDNNVFDIQQGVAIGIFVKHKGDKAKSLATVRHADLWGKREEKYQQLLEMNLNDVKWKEITPSSHFYLFVDRDEEHLNEYNSGFSIKEAFPVNGTGIITKRDKLTIDFDKATLWNRVVEFSNCETSEAYSRFNLPKDVRDWSVERAKADLHDSGLSQDHIKPILYRPFDIRYVYNTGNTRGFIGWPVTKIMKHILSSRNFGLVTTRQSRDEWSAFACNKIVGHKSLAAYDINTLFPLFLIEDDNLRYPNLSTKFINSFTTSLNLQWQEDGQGDLETTFGPEDVFYYIYAIFHSPGYRQRYAEFLKIDFPRVPITKNLTLFQRLVPLGQRLIELHTMEKQAELITTYPASGDHLVEKAPEYVDTEQRVYINNEQYFTGVPKRVWQFHIGGYQVAHKWLKDRKGRKLSYDEITTYQQIIAALAETIDLMKAIDEIIDESGGWPL